MRLLQDLPVWVVIRLCTDDDNVVKFWNNIDGEVKLDMDVLDDPLGEAREVHMYVLYMQHLSTSVRE